MLPSMYLEYSWFLPGFGVFTLLKKWASSHMLKILLHIKEIPISNKKILHLLGLGDICLIIYKVIPARIYSK